MGQGMLQAQRGAGGAPVKDSYPGTGGQAMSGTKKRLAEQVTSELNLEGRIGAIQVRQRREGISRWGSIVETMNEVAEWRGNQDGLVLMEWGRRGGKAFYFMQRSFLLREVREMRAVARHWYGHARVLERSGWPRWRGRIWGEWEWRLGVLGRDHYKSSGRRTRGPHLIWGKMDGEKESYLRRSQEAERTGLCS